MRLAALALSLVLPAAAFAAGAQDVAANAYTLKTTQGTLSVKKGATAPVHVEVVPRQGAHVSPDAPVHLTFAPPAQVTLAKDKLGRGESKETPQKGIAFDVPVTGAAAGKGELKGKLVFFICTEKLCERQQRDLAFAVEVK